MNLMHLVPGTGRLFLIGALVSTGLGLGAAVPAAAADRSATTLSRHQALFQAKRSLCVPDIALTSLANGRFVSAELGYTGADEGMLRARAGQKGTWERFTICFDGVNSTIRSQANGRYVSAELSYGGADNGMLRARATVVGSWERFSFESCGDRCTVIRSTANGRLVSAELRYAGADYAMLRARATAVGEWERFQ
ncbi:fascin domain-containing protein [Rhizohabitans arisaemae]|uniref:fascin domain-containing protein n=1 Tax=Rhizohabitans arisaemae TaxID=2720610 RepID=UPI0024B0A4AC|nr:hypothetical protein [Rhizohabitans arisaemae]